MRTAPPVTLAVVLALGLYLLVTSAFFPLGFLSVFDAKRMLQLGVFFALLLFAMGYSPLRKATLVQLMRFPKPTSFVLFTLFLIGIVSSLRLPHPAYSLFDVSMIFVMLLLVFVTAASRSLAGPKFDRWAVIILATMGFAVAVQEFMGYLSGWVLGVEFSYERLLVHFANPRFYNQLQTWSIPVLASLPIIFPNKKWLKLACIMLIGLQWFLVFSTGARGTFICLLTAMVFIAFWLPNNCKHWLKSQMSGFLVGILLYMGIVFLNTILIPQSGNFYLHSVGRPMMHTSLRSMLWGLSLEDAKRHPILGAGPTRFACGASETTSPLPSHPHSFPIRIMGEWGFIALSLLLFLAITIGVKFLGGIKRSYIDTHQGGKNADSLDPALQSILAISVLAGAMHACLSGLLIMPASQVAMILISGWTLSLAAKSHPEPLVYPVTNLVLITGLLLATAQLVFAIREIPSFPVRTGYSKVAVRLAPRIWWTGRTCDYRYTTDKK